MPVIVSPGPASALVGTAGNDTIFGGAESDSIRGLAGDDELSGGRGADSIEGSVGNDRISAGVWSNGFDEYERETTSDTLYGGEGNDTIDAHNGAGAIAFGGAGNDSLIGGGMLYGGPGNDRYLTTRNGAIIEDLLGSNSIEFLVGRQYTFYVASRVTTGDGNDTIAAAGVVHAGGGDDYIGNTFLRSGFDPISGIAYGEAGNDTIEANNGYGGDGDDYIVGLSRADGGAGDDTLIGGSVLQGGAGNDTYYVFAQGSDRRASVAEIVDLDGETIVTGAVVYDNKLSRVSTAAFVGRIEVGNGNDTVDLRASVIIGGGGDDRLSFGRLVRGGEGNDSIWGDTVFGDGGDDTLRGNIVDGGDGDDLIVATRGYGGAGDDRISIQSRSGLAEGGEGNDTLVGRGEFRGGAGDDRYEISFRLGHDIVDRLGASVILGQTSGAKTNTIETGDGDDLIRVGALSVWAAGGDDTVEGALEIYGGDGEDDLSGRAVFGEGGNDTIIAVRGFGGEGDDVVNGRVVAYGGAGNDSITGERAYGNAGNDTIEATAFANGGAGNDVISGGARVAGGGGDDIVTGGGVVDLGSGDDRGEGQTVLGGVGDDTVWARTLADGGEGEDTLLFSAGLGTSIAGGEGADEFVLRDYNPSRFGVVTITDFEVGSDVVDLTALEWWRSDVTWIRNGDDIAIRDGERVTILILEIDDGAAFSDLSIVV